MSTSSHLSHVCGNVKWIYLIILVAILTATHFLFFDYDELRSIVSNTRLGSSLVVLDGDAEAAASIGDDTIAPHETPIPLLESPFTEPEPLEPGEEYLAICMAVKNQAADLPEFLMHHYYHIGIRRFYIWDDGSQPRLEDKPDYGVPRSALTFIWSELEKEGVRYRQPVYYNECVSQFGGNHTWFAFIDADEFFETTGDQTLEGLLREFEKNETIGALGVTWRTHTSNNLLSRPKSNRKAFTTCISNYDDTGKPTDNKHIKSIVRSSAYEGMGSPHHFILKGGAYPVGEHGEEIPVGPFRESMSTEIVALHHYGVKSKQEYEEKINRSNAMGDPKGWNWWKHIEEDMPHVQCLEMAKYDP